MENEEINRPKKQVHRSPGYPIIGLRDAVEKAIILWNKDTKNTIHAETALEHLGYKKSGYALRMVAALKKFSLISEGQNGIKLTEDAIDLALHEPTDEKYKSILKKLATTPSIYEKILSDNNGCIPSDAELKRRLIKDYDFNPESVDDFIVTFKDTMEYAGLTGDTSMRRTVSLNPRDAIDDDETPDDKHSGQSQGKPIIMKGTIYPIPLSKGKQAAIAFETLPVKTKDIEAIKKWLDLFQDSLTEDEDN